MHIQAKLILRWASCNCFCKIECNIEFYFRPACPCFFTALQHLLSQEGGRVLGESSSLVQPGSNIFLGMVRAYNHSTSWDILHPILCINFFFNLEFISSCQPLRADYRDEELLVTFLDAPGPDAINLTGPKQRRECFTGVVGVDSDTPLPLHA